MLLKFILLISLIHLTSQTYLDTNVFKCKDPSEIDEGKLALAQLDGYLFVVKEKRIYVMKAPRFNMTEDTPYQDQYKPSTPFYLLASQPYFMDHNNDFLFLKDDKIIGIINRYNKVHFMRRGKNYEKDYNFDCVRFRPFFSTKPEEILSCDLFYHHQVFNFYLKIFIFINLKFLFASVIY